MKEKKKEYKIVKAVIPDVVQIHKIVNSHAQKGDMLPRSLNAIYENIRDFFVAKSGDKVLGCGALHIDWSDLAEIKAVAVDAEYHKSGIGKEIVEACINEAKELGLKKVFLLTYKPEFFGKYGFNIIDKNELPHKVWSECINCPKFPDCNETAMIQYL